MKLTWFGGTALRIHIGGRIVVCDPQTAASGVNQAELVSGADAVFQRTFGAPTADPFNWRPRRQSALLDTPEEPEVMVHDFGMGAAVVDAVGEPPLALFGDGLMSAGRWTSDAVVVAFNAIDASYAIDLHSRLLLLAFDDFSLQPAFDQLSKNLDGTALVALERGMALEV